VTQLAFTLTYARFADELQGSEPADGDSPLLEATLAQLMLRHHFGQGWSADLSLPAGSITLEPGGHESTRRLSGLGDIEAGMAYDFSALWGAGGYRPSLTLRLGLGLPTGRHGTLGEEGHGADSVPPSVLSIGYGAYGGAAELRLTQFAAPWLGISPAASVRRPFGANESGVTMGTSTSLGVDALLLPSSWLLLSVGGALQSRTHSREEEEGRIANSGGRALFATASATARVSPLLSFGLGGRVPLHTHVNGRQIVESYSVLGTVSLTFGGGEDEHDDEHAHGDEHGDEHAHGDEHGDEHAHAAPEGESAAATADVRDAAAGGRGFELSSALVPGKVTVIDFWAEWCHPCAHIDATLRRLASQDASLAVRRVEVPDFDSEVATRHLAGEKNLPLLWLFDAKGQRRKVLRNAADVEASVRALLREHAERSARPAPSPAQPTHQH